MVFIYFMHFVLNNLCWRTCETRFTKVLLRLGFKVTAQCLSSWRFLLSARMNSFINRHPILKQHSLTSGMWMNVTWSIQKMLNVYDFCLITSWILTALRYSFMFISHQCIVSTGIHYNSKVLYLSNQQPMEGWYGFFDISDWSYPVAQTGC